MASGFGMRYRTDRIKTFKFKLPEPNYQPFYIIQDLEECLQHRDIVMCIISDLDGYITCTVCGNGAVENMLLDNRVVIANKFCPYQLCQNRWNRIRILQPPSHLRTTDIDNILRQYGKVLVSEFETKSRYRIYFAVIELRTALPQSISLKRHMCELIIEDCN